MTADDHEDSAVPAPVLRGHLDIASRSGIEGWAQDPADPDAPVRLVVRVDGTVLTTVLADRYRADLAEAGIGSGCHGFVLGFASPLPPGPARLQVQRMGDGMDLPGSPAMVHDPDVPEGPRGGPGDGPAVLEGTIDVLDWGGVAGWARDAGSPDAPVGLLVSVDGRPVARMLANAYRPDLEAAGLGPGRHGFSVQMGLNPLQPCTVRVQRDGDGADLPGSPVRLDAARVFDAGMQDALARLLADPPSDADAVARLEFLAAQAERLLQGLADRRGGRAMRDALRQVKWRTGTEDAPDPALRRALVIDERVPATGRDAGSQALVSHMESLARLGYEVSFVASDVRAADVGAADSGADGAAGLGVAVYHAPWTGSVEEVLRRQAGCFDVVYLHRVGMARYIPLVRLHQRRARLVFSVADLSHLRVGRQAEVEARPELRQHSARLRAAEFAAARAADAVVTHSAYEAALLRVELPAGLVHVVPWSVPAVPTAVPFAERSGLAFIGGYGHTPNVDAALYLVGEVMPLVWAEDPAVTCTLVGAQMPDSVRALAGPGVVVAGHVPALGRVFDAVRLTVAPLLFGAGVKGKVLASLAAGVPCVCTPVAAEGLPLPPVLAAQGDGAPRGLADAILRLHGDPVLNAAAAAAGLAMVREGHTAAAVDAALRVAVGGPIAR